jgi:pre-mRNA-processing factor 19
MFCAISGEVPTEAVVSTKSGHLFEKKLIEKYLASEDTCPVTGEPLSIEDLLPLKATHTARPRPITATSIPGLLSHFQNEWDAVMLETFTLKQHLDSTRKELSQVLYQHDAACRVIARLVRERDEARAMLGARQGTLAQAAVEQAETPNGNGMDVDVAAAAIAAGITDAIQGAIAAKGKELSKTRKKRPVPATLASTDDIKQYQTKSSVTPHATKTPGVTCLDLHASANLTVSGGADKAVIVFDHDKGQVASTLNGHSKKVTSVKFHPDVSSGLILSSSNDKTVRLWGNDGASNVVNGFDGEVNDVCVHPTGDYACAAGKDGWSFISLNYSAIIAKESGAFESACFHPDGLLLGLATQSNAEIWDMKTQKKIHTFEGGHGGVVNTLDFSENGYLMASGCSDGTVKLWDLRKLKDLKTLSFPGKPVNSLKFDHSGVYLAAGSGNEVVVNIVKAWDTINTLSGHSKEVMAVSFNRDATTIASASMDRCVKLWGK